MKNLNWSFFRWYVLTFFVWITLHTLQAKSFAPFGVFHNSKPLGVLVTPPTPPAIEVLGRVMLSVILFTLLRGGESGWGGSAYGGVCIQVGSAWGKGEGASWNAFLLSLESKIREMSWSSWWNSDHFCCHKYNVIMPRPNMT